MSLAEIGQKAKAASKLLALTSDETRQAALRRMAQALLDKERDILSANALDLSAALEQGYPTAFADRLKLSPDRVKGMAEGLISVSRLPDPLHQELERFVRPNGLVITKVSVPLGVIAVIYEARPNVTAESSALCLKSGNAVILRGGKEAYHSNRAIVEILREALSQAQMPVDAVQLISDLSRESAHQLMHLNEYVDVLLPRGGKGLIDAVVREASVPVIQTGAGVCHIYVDQEADLDMAARITVNAKTSRPSVCNACECLLVHEGIAQTAIPLLCERLKQKNVRVKGDEGVCALFPDAEKAEAEDWGREFLDLIIAVKLVSGLEEAMAHIAQYGTGHSEAIITRNLGKAAQFQKQVDAACVYHNASTRFTDGGEFGFGAEIGISTQKLHARGPVGLRELTSYKYWVSGEGQVR